MTSLDHQSLARAMRAAATDALVGDPAFRKILEVTEVLPPLHGGVSLECHLGRGHDRTDLLARAMHSDSATLARQDAPALAQARRFSAWWSAAPSAHRVHYVDLEFDMDGSTGGCFVGPMIEPTLPRGMAAVMEAMRPAGSAGARFDFAVQVLEAPGGEPFAGCPEAALRRCFDELPPDGFIGHAGSLRSRTLDGRPLVRLIPSVRRSDLGPYLRRVKWPGDLAHLEAAADRYLGATERIDLDLDMRAHGLTPNVGFCRTFWDGGLVVAPLQDCLERMRTDWKRSRTSAGRRSWATRERPSGSLAFRGVRAG